MSNAAADALATFDADATGNRNAYWDERDFRPDAGRVRASVLVAHGLNDTNVTLGKDTTEVHDLPRPGRTDHRLITATPHVRLPDSRLHQDLDE